MPNLAPPFRITIETEPSKRDLALISDRLFEYNQKCRGDDFTQLAIFIRDTEGTIIAGISALVRWNWAHIDVLWVSESYRKMGYGSKLLMLAEEQFRLKNCTFIDLDTFNFQAPHFYASHGFEISHELDIDGTGTKKIFFKKKLSG